MDPITGDRLVDKKAIGARLSRVMDELGIEKHGRGSMLARLTGTSPQAAARWLLGDMAPSTVNLMRIAIRYRVRPEYLLLGQEPVFRDADLDELEGHYQRATPAVKKTIRAIVRELSGPAN